MHRSSGKSDNPWGKTPPVKPIKAAKSPQKQPQPSKNNVNQRFEQAKKEQQAAVSKFIETIDSSSEEEELAKDSVIGLTIKNYGASLGRTQTYLEDALTSGAATCLICISTVKRVEKIWSCVHCYAFFHLMCIQRWSKDTITQKKRALTDQIQLPRIQIVWGCPKCRTDYDPVDIPEGYRCFCGKAENPVYQPLLVPHSCGELCGKKLQPLCGHDCKLLCHPGPCPPCAQTVTTHCYCCNAASGEKRQRCSNREWSCGAICARPLACNKHKCTQGCHAGNCAPCDKKSVQRCQCGGVQKLRDCSQPIWQCDKICEKPLNCGFHICLELCHRSNDKSHDICQLSLLRHCPCGKTAHQLPCTEETPPCGDTCDKLLECGQHRCNQRCHRDACSQCVEIVSKSCRCGRYTNDVQCSKIYLCETKCKQVKDCAKHPCNRKCCDGFCPPCEKPCNRTLNCGNHRCSSVCHRGPCFPCQMTDDKYCRCSMTSVTVACGRKSKSKPPKCLQICTLPPNCHHDKQDDHFCHFGDCPPCKQPCQKSRDSCDHVCLARCHTAVTVVKQNEKKASMPWEQTAPKMEVKALPCPPCVVPMPVTCLGEHETANWPCHNSAPSSCHRACGRELNCGNHHCTIICHSVVNSTELHKAGDNCEKCNTACDKPRPTGCTHNCPRPCHSGNCYPCKQMVRIRCHCGLNQPYVACHQMTSVTDDDVAKEALYSCGNQCPNNYPCGHRCRANCHPPPCPDPASCRRKVKVMCACRRLRKDVICSSAATATVPCDESCARRLEEEAREKREVEEAAKREEEERNREELERYERKLGGGKKRNRGRRDEEEEEVKGWFERWWMVGVGGVVGVVSACYFIFSIDEGV